LFQGNSFHELLPTIKQRIIQGFTPEAYNEFVQEFRFFDKVTDISGALYPLPKEERRAGIRRWFYIYWLFLIIEWFEENQIFLSF